MPSLFIDVVARFAQFQESLYKIERQSNKFVNGLNGIFGRLQLVAGGIGAGLGLRELTQKFLETVEAADQLGKAAEKTGISVEALGAIKFAGDLNDLDFDSLLQGFKNLSNAIYENNKAFEELGLDPRKFATVEDAVIALADKFSKLRNPIEASALASQLFGRAGQQWLPLLKGGSENLRELTEEFKKLGGGVSEDFARSAEIFNDNMKKLGVSIDAAKNSIAGFVVEGLNELIAGLLDAKTVTGSFIDFFRLGKVSDLFASSVTKMMQETETEIRNARDELQALKDELNDPNLSFLRRERLKSDLPGLEQKANIDLPNRLEMLRRSRGRLIQSDPKTTDLVRRAQAGQFKDNLEIIAEARRERRTVKKEGASDTTFETLQRSLISKLSTELKLNEELTLKEDARFKRLSSNEQQQLIRIARRIDAIKTEAEAKKITTESEDVQRSIREITLRSDLDAIERRKIELKRYYEDGRLSAQEYYSSVAVQEDKSFSLQIADLEKIRALRQERAADTTRPIQDRLQSVAQTIDAEEKIRQLKLDQQDIEVSTARAIAQSDEETLRRQVEITQQLNRLLGKPDFELDKAALLEEFKDLPQEFRDSLTFKLFIDTSIAESQLQQFESNAQRIRSTLQVREERIDIDRAAGRITNFEAQTRIVEERKIAATQLQEQITKIQSIRDANKDAFGPEQRARLEELRNELARLTDSANAYLNTTKQIGEGPLQGFFEDILSGSERAANAFTKLVDSIKANIIRLFAEDITRGLFDQLKNIDLGSIGNILGGIGGGTKTGTATQTAITVGASLTPPKDVLNVFGGGSTGNAVPAVNEFTTAIQAGGETVKQLSVQSVDAAKNLTTMTTGLSVTGTGLQTFAPSITVATSGVQAALTTLTASITQAAAAIQAAAAQIAATSATSSASAGAGGLASLLGSFGGSTIPSASGNVFDHGIVAKYAVGGIVQSPTYFPMADGGTGLMGEAGPEAIMPLKPSGSGYAVHAVGANGGSTMLPLTRNSAGKLSVLVPQFNASSATTNSYSYKYADGAVLSASKVSSVTSMLSLPSAPSIESTILQSTKSTSSTIHPFAKGGIITMAGGTVPMAMGMVKPTSIMPFSKGGVVKFASGGVLARSLMQTIRNSSNITDITQVPGQSGGVTVVQNISGVQDPSAFRRARSQIYNDANAALAQSANRR